MWRNRSVLVLLTAVLPALGWSAGSLRDGVAEAAPRAQTSGGSPPGSEAAPLPTQDSTGPLPDPERGRPRGQTRLFDAQRERIEQEIALAGQAWPAPAEAASMVGPTVVGVLALNILAGALSRLLPPSAGRQAETAGDSAEDEDDF